MRSLALLVTVLATTLTASATARADPRTNRESTAKRTKPFLSCDVLVWNGDDFVDLASQHEFEFEFKNGTIEAAKFAVPGLSVDVHSRLVNEKFLPPDAATVSLEFNDQSSIMALTSELYFAIAVADLAYGKAEIICDAVVPPAKTPPPAYP